MKPTQAQILGQCDRQMLAAIARGQATADVREAFRLQLGVGMASPLAGARIETQADFIDPQPHQANGQALFF